MNWILSSLFLISFLSGWFLHSVFTPVSSCDFEFLPQQQKSTSKSTTHKRLPSSSSSSKLSRKEPVEELAREDNLEMNIYEEFKYKIALYTAQKNYEDKRLLIINAIETKLIEQDIINQVVSEEFQHMLNSGTSPHHGYFDDILAALPTNDRKYIFHQLDFHKAHPEIPHHNFEAFIEYFQTYR